MLLTIAVFILSTEKKLLMMVDRLLKITPDGKLTVLKSGLFGRKNVWLSEQQVLTLRVSVFLAV